MPTIQFTRLDGGSESIDLSTCVRYLVAPRSYPPSRVLDPSRTWLFARIPDGRWVLSHSSGDWPPTEVPKSEVYESMLTAGYWPIPAELSPEACGVPVSDPGGETANSSSLPGNETVATEAARNGRTPEAVAELPDLVTLDQAARNVPRGRLDEHAAIELTKNPSLTYEQLAAMLRCKPGTLRDKRKCPLLAAAKTQMKATKQEFYGKDKWTDRRPDD